MMKLEREKDLHENNFWFNIDLVLYLIGTIVITGTIFMHGLYEMLPFAILIIVFLIIILYLTNPQKQNGKNDIKVKEVGQKVEGNIIETGYERVFYHHHLYPLYNRTRGRDKIYYIVVSYDNKKMKAMDLKPNMAYKVLCLLLDPYPIKKDIYIPIDIYSYKKEIYIDLESVNLSKIEGFTEAKRIVEQTQDIN